MLPVIRNAPGGKGGRCVWLTIYHHYSAVVTKAGSLIPGKETRYPLYRRLDGSQGRSGRVRKISPPPGFDPRTVQPVASRYMPYLHELVVGENRRKPLVKEKLNKVRNIPNTSTKFIENNHNMFKQFTLRK